MAAPSSTKWGSAVGSSGGRIGINVTLSSTSTTTSVTVDVWFWSEWSVSDSSNSFYYSCSTTATSAATKIGSKTVSHSVASGGGWSTSNQTKIYSKSYSLSRSTSAKTYKVYAKFSGVEAIGSTMNVNTTFTVPALTKYTVTYNANGGSGAPSATYGYYGKSTTLSTTIPDRDDYKFVGWATSSSSTSAKYDAGDSVTLTSNLTLYAVWKQDVYKISYNANGGSGAPSPQTKTAGVNLTLSTTIPSRNGYTFAGWATSSTGSVAYVAGSTYSKDAEVTLYAVWTPWTHTVVFNANGGSGAPSSITAKTDSDNILPTTIPVYGNNLFKYWSNSIDASEEENIENVKRFYAGSKYNIIQNGGTVTLYANWASRDTMIFDDGVVECIEIVEDDNYGLYSDGTFHCKEFIEGEFIGFVKTSAKFLEFTEKESL